MDLDELKSKPLTFDPEDDNAELRRRLKRRGLEGAAALVPDLLDASERDRIVHQHTGLTPSFKSALDAARGQTGGRAGSSLRRKIYDRVREEVELNPTVTASQVYEVIRREDGAVWVSDGNGRIHQDDPPKSISRRSLDRYLHDAKEELGLLPSSQ